MKNLGLVIAALAFTGCAATTGPAPAPKAATTTATLQVSGNYSFPERISADGLDEAVADWAQLITRSYSGSVEAQVNVCVKPSGRVATASLATSSGIAGFDRAVTAAASAWKYKRAAAANARTRCKTVSVVYQSRG